jgi:hypothetical protein
MRQRSKLRRRSLHHQQNGGVQYKALAAHPLLQVLYGKVQYLLLCHRNRTSKARRPPSRHAIATRNRLLSHPMHLSNLKNDRSLRGPTMAPLRNGNSRLTLMRKTVRNMQATT